MGAKKRQNKIWEYRDMLQAWRRAKVMTWAGYILGFPTDTPESIARDIETIKRELPIDILEFFFLTPLPGSEDHKVLHLKGAWMEEDMNNYDLEHVCADHAIMSADVWRGVYRDAWARYYSDAHVETVLRRAVASGINPRKIADAMTVFSGSSRIERVHPLQFGYVRRKIRTQRRHGLKVVNPVLFYPWRAWDFLTVAGKWGALALRYRRILRRVRAGQNGAAYMDEALQPSTQVDHAHDFVAAYADKIPNTYGAPKRETAPAA
jgi:hypothetical protein